MLSAELKMLQAHKLDIEDLFEEYKIEFNRDMQYAEQHFSKKLPVEDDVVQEVASEDKDTLRHDPTLKNQRYRKTEDGWENETPPVDDDSAHIEPTSSKPAPKWAKKVYKKIAMASHPDRVQEEPNKEKLTRIFSKAAQCMSDEKFDNLLGLALELGIDIDDPEVDVIPLLQARINSIKEEVSSIEESLAWIWGEGFGCLELRIPIVSAHLYSKNLDINNDSLRSIIEEIESKSDGEHDNEGSE